MNFFYTRDEGLKYLLNLTTLNRGWNMNFFYTRDEGLKSVPDLLRF
jgi:hypothetical protein